MAPSQYGLDYQLRPSSSATLPDNAAHQIRAPQEEWFRAMEVSASGSTIAAATDSSVYIFSSRTKSCHAVLLLPKGLEIFRLVFICQDAYLAAVGTCAIARDVGVNDQAENRICSEDCAVTFLHVWSLLEKAIKVVACINLSEVFTQFVLGYESAIIIEARGEDGPETLDEGNKDTGVENLRHIRNHVDKYSPLRLRHYQIASFSRLKGSQNSPAESPGGASSDFEASSIELVLTVDQRPPALLCLELAGKELCPATTATVEANVHPQEHVSVCPLNCNTWLVKHSMSHWILDDVNQAESKLTTYPFHVFKWPDSEAPSETLLPLMMLNYFKTSTGAPGSHTSFVPPPLNGYRLSPDDASLSMYRSSNMREKLGPGTLLIAVITPASEVVVLSLFGRRILGRTTMTASGGVELVCRRDGRVLLIRQADKVVFLKLTYIDSSSNCTQDGNEFQTKIQPNPEQAASSTYSGSIEKVDILTTKSISDIRRATAVTTVEALIDLTHMYSYYDPVQKEKYEACCFSQDHGLNTAAVTSESQGFYQMYLFDLTANSGVQGLRLKADITKVRGFRRIGWILGEATLVGLTGTGSTILFFQPKLLNAWSRLIPGYLGAGFEQIDRNCELIEAEDEFDDWVRDDLQNHKFESAGSKNFVRRLTMNLPRGDAIKLPLANPALLHQWFSCDVVPQVISYPIYSPQSIFGIHPNCLDNISRDNAASSESHETRSAEDKVCHRVGLEGSESYEDLLDTEKRKLLAATPALLHRYRYMLLNANNLS